MTYKEAISHLNDLKQYMLISVHDRTASSPIKNRKLEAIYMEFIDVNIKQNCITCLIDKIMPRLLVFLSESNVFDIEEFINKHHKTQISLLDSITDIQTLNLIMECTGHPSVKNKCQNILNGR